MIESKRTIKYFIYARKSSESDEKQVQSIEDQISVLKRYQESNGLTVVDVLSEAKSAKEPNARPVFETLLKRIKVGEAHGILVWKIDRLSRNPIDGAHVQWLLQKGLIQSIRTPDREYRPEDNVLILSVESSMATQYILDLSKNVKRGLKSKIDKGWRPSLSPLGYLNTKTENRGENYIIKDPQRFPLIRKAWDLMLTGNCPPSRILSIMNKEWGVRTRKQKIRGSKPISKSGIYQIFSNIFYTGLINSQGVYIKGNHEPMITIEEFERVQFLLRRKGKPRYQHHEYCYNGIIKCGECGGTISATYKQKFIKTTGKMKDYYLYYCVCARKKTNNCLQRQYTNSIIIDHAIEEEIVSFTIHPRFKDWVLDVIDELKGNELSKEDKITEMQKETLTQINRQLENLTQLRLREMIDDEEYIKEKIRLKNEATILEQKISNSEVHKKDWLELTRNAFEFAAYAMKEFKSGTTHTKREILATLSGLNCTLKDKKLSIYKSEWLICLEKHYKSIQAKYNQFELDKMYMSEGQNGLFPSLRIELCALVYVIGTQLREGIHDDIEIKVPDG